MWRLSVFFLDMLANNKKIVEFLARLTVLFLAGFDLLSAL